MKKLKLYILLSLLLIVFSTNQVMARPSYHQGFARSPAESAHPEMWRGLVGAWVPSLGVTGGTLFDQNAFKNHGTLTNMDPATDWIIGTNGLYCLDFDATTESVKIPPNDSVLLLDKFSMVFAFEADADNGAIYALMPAGGANGHNSYILIADDSLRFELQSVGAGTNNINSTTAVVGAGVITAAFTYDTFTMRLYINGKEEVNIAHGAGTAVEYGSGAELWFGDRKNSPGSFDLNGRLFWGYYYNRALVPAEVLALHENPLAMFELRPLVYKAPAAAGARRIININ